MGSVSEKKNTWVVDFGRGPSLWPKGAWVSVHIGTGWKEGINDVTSLLIFIIIIIIPKRRSYSVPRSAQTRTCVRFVQCDTILHEHHFVVKNCNEKKIFSCAKQRQCRQQAQCGRLLTAWRLGSLAPRDLNSCYGSCARDREAKIGNLNTLRIATDSKGCGFNGQYVLWTACFCTAACLTYYRNYSHVGVVLLRAFTNLQLHKGHQMRLQRSWGRSRCGPLSPQQLGWHFLYWK